MKILVTGVDGFIGTNFAKAAAREHDVYGLYLPGTPIGECEPFVQGAYGVDIRDRDGVSAAFKRIRPDVVLHLAAKVGDTGPAKDYLDTNVLGVENCLDGAMAVDVSRFVFTSSLAVHGHGPVSGGNEDTPAQADYPHYSASKRLSEALVREASENMQTVIIRPGLLPFGPFDRLFSLRFAELITRGVVPMVNGGRARVNPAYAENLVQGLMLALFHPAAANETFVIADPPVMFRDLIQALSRALHRRPVKVSVPGAPLVVIGDIMERLTAKAPVTKYRARVVAKDFWFSTKKAERLLGYKSKIDLDEAASRTVEWVKSVMEAEGAQR